MLQPLRFKLKFQEIPFANGFSMLSDSFEMLKHITAFLHGSYFSSLFDGIP